MFIETRQGQINVNAPLTISIGSSSYQTAFGHPVLGSYVERFYTPILGPTQITLLRHVALEYHRTSRDLITSWRQLAQNVGLGPSARRLTKSLNRLEDYGAIQQTRTGYLFPTHLCTHRHARLQRLTPGLQHQHHMFITHHGALR